MRYLSLLFVSLFMVVASACHPNPSNYTHPVGYTPCQTDRDCRGVGHAPHEYCGFASVDTYPVCRQ